METSIQLWESFKSLFAEECRTHFPGALTAAWSSSGDRTKFYVQTIFPEIARQLNLKVRHELFKVDTAICRTSTTGHDVPLIFIESENNAGSATHEMWKLCSLNSPCRILIVCCEWSPDMWHPYGRQDSLLEQWTKIVKSHAEVWKLNGIIGIINAESGSVFRLTSAAWDEDGNLFEGPNKLLELQ